MNIGTIVIYWIEVFDSLMPRPAIVVNINDDDTVDITAFPGNGINDIKHVTIADEAMSECITLAVSE